MCGRFNRNSPLEELARMFTCSSHLELKPQYNIAPTHLVAGVRLDPGSTDRRLVLLRWGLIPPWATDQRIGAKMINARAETVAEKPAFKSPFRKRRCLVPADGFYEWRKVKGRKEPYYIRLKEEMPFAIAGLWERWEGPEGTVVESCTLITTEANDFLRPIHDRMPVILHPKDYDVWLDPTVQQPEAVRPLLQLFPSDRLTAYPVRPLVNNPTYDGPDCIQPREEN